MKQKTFILRDTFILSNAKLEMDKIVLDGTKKVTISDAKGKRSEAINRLMWKWLGEIQVFLRDSGQGVYSTDDIHEYMVLKLLPKVSVTINGHQEVTRARTSKMNNKEMSSYLELLDHYCGSELELSLTHPIDLFNEAFKR